MMNLPSLIEAKAKARILRQRAADLGENLSHSAALERVAHTYGFRDWNSFYASIHARLPTAWSIGARVRGSYLSQPFTATIITAESVQSGWARMSLQLDQAVDVVQFPSFSNYRKRIQCVVGPEGTSQERTSDGTPQMILEVIDA